MDDTGRNNRDTAGGAPPETGEALQQHIAESWQAIDAIQRCEVRAKRRRSLMIAGLICAVVVVIGVVLSQLIEINEPAGQPGPGDVVAWLAVPQPGSAAVRVFPAAQPGAESTSEVRLALELEPLHGLAAGDELRVDEGYTAHIFLVADGTHMEFTGPGTLLITDAGAVPAAGGSSLPAAQPVALWAAAVDSQPEVPEAETDTAIPLLLYPAGVNVSTGMVNLAWEYRGTEEFVTVTVRKRAGEVLAKHELDAAEMVLAVELEAGKGYRWDVAAGQEVSAAGEFRVLDAAQWEWVQRAAQSCGMPGEDIAEEAAATGSAVQLGALLSVLQANDLVREVAAVSEQLLQMSGM